MVNSILLYFNKYITNYSFVLNAWHMTDQGEREWLAMSVAHWAGIGREDTGKQVRQWNEELQLIIMGNFSPQGRGDRNNFASKTAVTQFLFPLRLLLSSLGLIMLLIRISSFSVEINVNFYISWAILFNVIKTTKSFPNTSLIAHLNMQILVDN